MQCEQASCACRLGHMSALRRTLCDGRAGNRFIINVPGRGYSFVTSVAVTGRAKPYGDENRSSGSMPSRALAVASAQAHTMT